MISLFTGLIAGAAHVWSGPDHLAAIAPLAVRRPRRSWLPGIRWGIGHSAGVASIGLLSLWLRELLPVQWLSLWGERLVGVMLIGIGLWALRRALQKSVHTHEHEHDGERHVHIHTHVHPENHETAGAHQHAHAAFGIGTLHGLAGSSHFLGVLPALAFPTTQQAITYLVAFGAGTVASMALFSWVMGLLSTRLLRAGVQVYRALLTGCAVMAMAVGGFWFVASWNGH